MTQFKFLQLFDETLSRYEQINKSSSSINVSTDSCIATLIPENDFFPNVTSFLLGCKQEKKVQEKKEHNMKMLP